MTTQRDELKTVKLRNGVAVLAKDFRGTACAVTYANYTQANARVAALRAAGIEASAIRYGGPVVYIVID